MTHARQPATDAGGTCPDFEVLSCYADGELDDGRQADVAEHVATCSHCATLAGRLREGFQADEARRDGGIGGSRCAGEELLVLYASLGLPGDERAHLDTHLASCDACVSAVVLLHRRLSLAGVVAAPVPAAVMRRADAAFEAGMRELAPVAERWHPVVQRHRPDWFERLSHWWRVPVLVPAALAAGALLLIGVLPRGPHAAGERSRAVAPATTTLRVTAVEATVRARPSMQSAVVGTIKRGEQLEVASEERDWYEVRLAAGGPGWVLREAFE
jgi:anti-sigma factor RsiW